jgi:glycosyltransferase involved in cell wall biosynthesis
MRICHVTAYFQGNMGYQENYLPAAQKKLGHEVLLLTSDRLAYHPKYQETMKWSEDARIVGEGRFVEDGFDVVRMRTTWEWGAHWWVYCPDLWKEIEAFAPDVIHLHCINGMLSYQTMWGNLSHKRTLVVDDHNNYFNKVPYTWKKWVFYQALKWCLLPVMIRSVKRVLPMSHEVRDYLRTELGVPRSMTTLNHLGADPEKFRFDAALRTAVRAKLGIGEDRVVIINSGKITEVKDNHVLLDAFAKVVRQDPRAYLIMVGNAPQEYRAELNAIIAREGISGDMVWLDFLPHDELTAHYSAADIGCWPGDWSCTVIEAASCSVALVQPDLLYTKYSSANGNSLNFKRGDAEDLADKLLTLVRDDARREDMRRRSRELIERELNWDALARQTIDIYTRCIESQPFPAED